MTPLIQKITIDSGYGAMISITDLSRPVVFTFDNLGTTGDVHKRDGWGYAWLRKQGYNVVAFMESKGDRRYAHDDFIPFMKMVLNRISTYKFKKKISYGSSMGAYAALAYAKILKANCVVAICPRATANLVNGGKLSNFNDTLCKNWVKPWQSDSTKYLRSIRCMTVYDPIYHDDHLHARMIPGEKYKAPGLGHMLEVWLRPYNMAKQLLEEASGIPNKSFPLSFARQLRGRRNQARYFMWMLSHQNTHRTKLRDSIIGSHAFHNELLSRLDTKQLCALRLRIWNTGGKSVLHPALEKAVSTQRNLLRLSR